MASAKLERLMNLVAALLHTSVPLSAQDIRSRVGGYSDSDVAFHRQFSRDKQDLREMGVPIRVEPVPDAPDAVEGYRVDPDDYYLRDPGLEPDELAALHLATRLVSIPSSGVPGGLFKLGGLTSVADPDVTPRAVVPALPGLGVLFEAIGDGSVVGFTYRDRDRRLAPRALAFRQGYWYVSGRDLDTGDDRVYRVDRVSGTITPTGDASPRTPARSGGIGPLEPWSIGGEEHFMVRLHVDATTRPAMVTHLGADAVVATGADGSAEFAIDVTNPDGFVTWVLGFSDTVEVIEPPSLREAVIARLRAVAEGDR